MTSVPLLRLVACFTVAIALSVGSVSAIAQGSRNSAPAEGVLILAREKELDELDARIGRFVSGDQAVYAGKLTISEYRNGTKGVSIAFNRVVGWVEGQDELAGGSGVSLTIVSAEYDFWIEFRQSSLEPGTTWSTLLRPIRATAGVRGSCKGCLADLSKRPQTLAFGRFAAVGRLRDVSNTRFRVEVFGSLERIPPAHLNLKDLELLNPGIEPVLRGEVQNFVRQGREGVLGVEGRLRKRIPPPKGAPSQTRCERVYHYSAERFVDLEDLKQFGVRDLKLLGTEVCCLNHDGHAESEQCSEEEPQ